MKTISEKSVLDTIILPEKIQYNGNLDNALFLNALLIKGKYPKGLPDRLSFLEQVIEQSKHKHMFHFHFQMVDTIFTDVITQLEETTDVELQKLLNQLYSYLKVLDNKKKSIYEYIQNPKGLYGILIAAKLYYLSGYGLFIPTTPRAVVNCLYKQIMCPLIQFLTCKQASLESNAEFYNSVTQTVENLINEIPALRKQFFEKDRITLYHFQNFLKNIYKELICVQDKSRQLLVNNKTDSSPKQKKKFVKFFKEVGAAKGITIFFSEQQIIAELGSSSGICHGLSHNFLARWLKPERLNLRKKLPLLHILGVLGFNYSASTTPEQMYKNLAVGLVPLQAQQQQFATSYYRNYSLYQSRHASSLELARMKIKNPDILYNQKHAWKFKEKFCKQLIKMPNNFIDNYGNEFQAYFIEFSGKNIGHSIAYVKDNYGVWFYDATFGLVLFPHACDSMKLFQAFLYQHLKQHYQPLLDNIAVVDFAKLIGFPKISLAAPTTTISGIPPTAVELQMLYNSLLTEQSMREIQPCHVSTQQCLKDCCSLEAVRSLFKEMNLQAISSDKELCRNLWQSARHNSASKFMAVIQTSCVKHNSSIRIKTQPQRKKEILGVDTVKPEKRRARIC